MPKYTPEDRFWSKVNKNGSIPIHMPHLGKCWEWIAGKNQCGYGMFYINNRICRAHRISWEMVYGNVQNKLWVLHRCDNLACVNPKHLFLGTVQDNVDDMISKNRHPRGKGEKAAHHKLTQEQVTIIRNRYAIGNISMKKLGNEYGVSAQTIHNIIHRRKWRDN